MKKERVFNTLIADDEPEAVELVKSFLAPHTDFKIMVTTTDPLEARIGLESGDIDVAFLDIEFRGNTVFDIVKGMKTATQLVFISAYENYALRAIKESVFDYLLKPIDPDEFDDMIDKLRNTSISGVDVGQALNSLEQGIVSTREQRIAIPTQHGYTYYQVKDIVSVSASGSYCNLIDKDRKSLLVSRNLSDFERILSPKGFIRIHRSHLINADYMASFSRVDGGTVEMITGETFTISRKYRDKALDEINSLSEKV